MAVLPFRRHGRTRVEAIASRLQSAADAWLQGWSTAISQCQVHHGQDGQPANQGLWLQTRDGAVVVWLPSLGMARLGCALAGVPMGEGQKLAEAIGRRALNELASAWLGVQGLELHSADGFDPEALQLRHGVLPLRLALGALTLEFHLSPAACDALVAPRRTAPVTLVGRREAFAGSTVRLHATLDLGGAALDAAATLRPGEIIRATAIQDAVVSVHSGDGAVLFRGALDSIDGRKALRCTGVQTH